MWISRNELRGAHHFLIQSYSALLKQGKREEAKLLAEKILTIDDTAETWYQLAFCGVQAPQAFPEHLEQAHICFLLTGGKDVLVLNLLAQLLGIFGRGDEGLNLIDRFLPLFETDERILLHARRRHLLIIKRNTGVA